MGRLALAALMLALPGAALAQTPTNPIDTLAFLVGTWDAGQGRVADTGGTSRGRSTISAELGGKALLRRDHTDLFDKAGKPMGSFEQIMLIYPEAGTLHADYDDGTHIIHYTGAEVTPGHAVTFTSPAAPGAPAFRLTYTLTEANTLAIAFGMVPPGGAFRPIATGTLTKAK